MERNELLDAINVPFIFAQRPQSLDIDYRPTWRMGIVLLCLNYSRNGKSSLIRLQLLDWCLREKRHAGLLLEFLHTTSWNAGVTPSKDDSLITALKYLLIKGLIRVTYPKSGGIRYEVTELGYDSIAWLLELNDVYVFEKEYLEKHGAKITEKLVNQIYIWGEDN